MYISGQICWLINKLQAETVNQQYDIVSAMQHAGVSCESVQNACFDTIKSWAYKNRRPTRALILHVNRI